jgi:hypothetical protein
MSLAAVYRISSKNLVAGDEEVDTLARKLRWELPIGYREYVTTLGTGSVCDFLYVNMPKESKEPRYKLAEYLSGWWFPELFTRHEWDEAIIFALTDQRPLFFSSPRFSPQLVQLCDDWIQETPNGFYGLVDLCASWMRHDFPFFEPNNGRRRMRVFAVRPSIGHDGFVDSMARRWGLEGLRCSRTASDELYPHFFVAAIEGHIELLLDASHNRLPPDCFYVRARYDIDSEPDVAAFVEAMSLPGGSPSDYLGEA